MRISDWSSDVCSSDLGPVINYAGGAEGLKVDAEEAGVDLYVHAPYLLNVATTNNRQRIPSRKLLQQHMNAAASIRAQGLTGHGSHHKEDDDPSIGFHNRRKAKQAPALKLPPLPENPDGANTTNTRPTSRTRGGR